MNFIDAAGTLADSAILLIRDGAALDAKNHVRNVVAAYDALAPNWSEAPDDAMWYTIDADNTCYWHPHEPTHAAGCWESGAADYAGVVIVEDGIDWRLCKWSRPEVTA